MPFLPQRTHSLGARLVIAILGFCVVFTLLTVGVRTWWAWRANVKAMAAELGVIEEVFRRTLSKGIWEMDRESLDTHLSSAANVPAVGRVVLKVALTHRPPEVFDRSKAGWKESTLAPSRHLALVYEPFEGSRETLGELTLYGDENELWARLRGEVLAIVTTQLIQSLLLAGLLMLLFTRSVTVHVQRIARHLAQLTPSSLRNPLSLERRSRRNDELEMLVSGVNSLQDKLAEHIEQQQRYETELAQHRDHLAELVKARTSELLQGQQALRAANEQLAELARHDPLTGLSNRRHFDEMKETEFRRAKRLGQPLSLLVCDIDHFKRFNDAHGHALGDECLRAVAQAIKSAVRRAGDIVARIGGEEFVVLLPSTDAAAAQAMAERILESVESARIVHGDSDISEHVTLSIGLASMASSTVESFDALFALADRALYRSKASGRNRVTLMEEA